MATTSLTPTMKDAYKVFLETGTFDGYRSSTVNAMERHGLITAYTTL